MKKVITLTMASVLLIPQSFLYADEGRQGEQGMPVMCEHMQEMMGQMEEIRKADDQAERDKLVQEHMQTMHEAMAMHKKDGKMSCPAKEAEAEKLKKRHDHRKTK
ncbi:hypothetical protein MNBD_GAMMA26-1767 [hydrothermal vent metagenome]|uniref:Uncharacterized protein n=1 Tax=hydrothermal vent metagenome TaxID=652676 RepID=A0A3B1BGJ7_9ZZZZ